MKTAMKANSKQEEELLKALAQLSCRESICLLDEGTEEGPGVYLPFLRLGLYRNQKCLYIATEIQRHAVIKKICSTDESFRDFLAREALEIVTQKDLQEQLRVFSPDRLIHLMEKFFEQSREQGFDGLRIVADMNWEWPEETDRTQWLLDFSSQMSNFAYKKNVPTLCIYDRNKFPSKILRDIILKHSRVISGGRLCPNHYYLPPDIDEQAPVQLNRLLETIREQHERHLHLRWENERLQIQNELAKSLSGNLFIEELCDRIVDIIRKNLPCDAFFLCTYHPSTKTSRHIRLYDTIGNNFQAVETTALQKKLPEEVHQTVIEEQKTLLIHRKAGSDGPHLTSFGDNNRLSMSLLIVPLCVSERTMGLFSVQSYTPEAYDERSIMLLEAIAHQAAPALQSLLLGEQLRRNEERLRLILEQAPAAIWTTDNQLRLTTLEGTGLAGMGIDVDRFLGRDISTIQTGAFAQLLQAHHKALQGENSTIENKWGEKFFQTFIRPLLNPRSETIGVIAISQEITDRKKTEALTLQSARMEATSQLAGGIAHEFNNLMMGVLGNAQLLEKHPVQETAKSDILRKIAVAAERAGELSKQLLAFARAGKYQPRSLNMNRHLKQILMFQQNSLPNNIHLECDFEPDPHQILADPDQLSQLILALYNNAIEAIDQEGIIRIKTRNLTLTENDLPVQGMSPGKYCLMSFEDNGKGMSENTISRIYDPFFTTKAKKQGLGMAAAYGIVKNHNGGIRIKSELGRGARIDVYLPTIDSEPWTVPEEIPQVSLKGKTILIADDDEMVLEISRKLLESLGCHVLEAAHGQKAVEVARKSSEPIDLVLLDLRMPVMSGVEAFRPLAQARPQARIVLCSGFDLDENARSLLSSGASAFLQKPYKLEDMQKILQQALAGPPASLMLNKNSPLK
jgi:PAS domain S-box-containing protein